ncbi:hypothetical protein R1flu_025586 [Riccia fluitans]|uniref:Uncharacterized protein n=1 Tax=Riccia fluitans TaxID=41844 RepID=A0ABD1XY70_9MARC
MTVCELERRGGGSCNGIRNNFCSSFGSLSGFFRVFSSCLVLYSACTRPSSRVQYLLGCLRNLERYNPTSRFRIFRLRPINAVASVHMELA